VPRLLVILAIPVLVALRGVSYHLIWSFEEWLMLNFLQNLMHWVLEYSVDCLCISKSKLPYKVSH